MHRLLPLLVLLGCSGTTVRSAPVERPNIVLILADDLGIGEVGAWGQTEIATPAIDQLAREGMRLTAFRSSAAVCGPARCSLMLGLHNGHCRLDDNDSDYLRDADVTLAERLQSLGYATGLFGKWGLSFDAQPESWPQAQGFDAFFGYRDQVHAHNFYPEYLIDGTDSLRTGNVVPKPTRMGAGAASVKRAYAPDLIRDRAFAFMRANAERPFFVYWATNLPHIHNETHRTAADGGYEVPDLGPYADKPWPLPKRSYAAQVHRLDQDVAAIRTLLDSLGVAERTLIIFASDNGATFLRVANDGSTDIAGRWFNGTQDYRGFKGDLYEGGLRVPAIVHWPGRITRGSQSAVTGDFADLHATLLDAAGGAVPGTIDGRSLLPVLTGQRATGGRPHLVWFSPDRRQAAVLEGRYKAVWMRDTMRVFDLEADPGETTDLRTTLPGVVARLDAIRQRERRDR
jgi:arylsulfatase A-like enzyme